MQGETLQLLKDLISEESVTPDDKNCQQIIKKRLSEIGFDCEEMNLGDTKNLWTRIGDSQPLVCFAGHTDVVPAGNLADWKFPPFEPTIKDGILYGRGSADMKSGLAASITAVERFLANNNVVGSIAFLITSDEEGSGTYGTKKVVEILKARNILIDYAIVAEPTSSKELGDIIKNGRRGSLSAKLIIKGKQGHIAYPQLAVNPIEKAMPALEELINLKWDNGNQYFPPTSFQISNIKAGTGVTNIIPGSLEIDFNFRFSSENDFDKLSKTTINILDKYQLNYEIVWDLSGKPFITNKGKLTDIAFSAIEKICHLEPKLDTGGGTSDGRFIKEIAQELIEFGPINQSIHQVNENIKVLDIIKTSLIYEEILLHIFSN